MIITEKLDYKRKHWDYIKDIWVLNYSHSINVREYENNYYAFSNKNLAEHFVSLLKESSVFGGESRRYIFFTIYKDSKENWEDNIQYKIEDTIDSFQPFLINYDN